MFPHPKQRLSKKELKRLPPFLKRNQELDRTAENLWWERQDAWYSAVVFSIIGAFIALGKPEDDIVKFCVDYFPKLNIPYWWYQVAERDLCEGVIADPDLVQSVAVLLQIIPQIPMNDKPKKSACCSCG